MDYENKSSFKKSFLSEEDVNFSAFRRRNKLLILIFLFLIISLTVIIGALIIFLLPNTTSSQPYQPLVNPAVEAFCTVSNDKKSCLSTFNPIISPKSKTNPNQIFTLSLQTAAKELDNIIPLSSISDGNRTENIAFKKCSVLLRDGLSRIGDALATMRVNPLVENQSDEQMIEMMNWIYTAWDDLESCVDDLDEMAESTAVSELKKKVLQAKEYVNNSQDFLRQYGSVLQIYSSWILSDDRGLNLFETDRGLDLEIVFSVCMCVLELLFMFVLFWSLFRIR